MPRCPEVLLLLRADNSSCIWWLSGAAHWLHMRSTSALVRSSCDAVIGLLYNKHVWCCFTGCWTHCFELCPHASGFRQLVCVAHLNSYQFIAMLCYTVGHCTELCLRERLICYCVLLRDDHGVKPHDIKRLGADVHSFWQWLVCLYEAALCFLCFAEVKARGSSCVKDRSGIAESTDFGNLQGQVVVLILAATSCHQDNRVVHVSPLLEERNDSS